MMNKLFQHIGLFSFGIYFIFASVFYQERTLFLDNPFQVFLMIVEGDIAVNAHRWPAVIIRVIPYLLIQLGAPLKIVLLSFSLSYWLFHFVVFNIIRYRLKEQALGLLQVATVTLPIVHSFFWCNSEQNLAISLLVLILALFKQRKLVWTGVMCFVLIWLHPLMFLPFGFVMSFYAVDAFLKKEGHFGLKTPVLFGLSFLVMYILKSVYIKNWYDNIKAIKFQHNLSTYDWNVVGVLEPFLVENYFLFPAMVIGALCLLMYKGSFLKAGLWSVFVLAYLVILNISNSGETSYLFYDEVNYLILFFGAAFILKDFIKARSKIFKRCLFGGAATLVMINWVITAGFYSERISWYNSFVESNDRAIHDFKDADQKMIIMPWASAYESLIISELKGKSSTALISKEIAKYSLDSSEKVFYGEFKTYDLQNVNRRYFSLDVSEYYLR
ncbi:hypothetical protein N9176_01165 [bacterium]|nr:hypothetical protein [bacterium]